MSTGAYQVFTLSFAGRGCLGSGLMICTTSSVTRSASADTCGGKQPCLVSRGQQMSAEVSRRPCGRSCYKIPPVEFNALLHKFQALQRV